ncbi:hypothetical protein ACFQ0T_00480 [Kitasatospora gansuensis]
MGLGDVVVGLGELFEEGCSCGAGLGLVAVELPGHVRPVELEGGDVDGVAPDKEVGGAAADVVDGVAGCVARGGDRGEPFVDRGLLRHGDDPFAHRLQTSGEHGGVARADPDALEFGERLGAVRCDQAADVVFVFVGDGDVGDVCGVDSGFVERVVDQSHGGVVPGV